MIWNCKYLDGYGPIARLNQIKNELVRAGWEIQIKPAGITKDGIEMGVIVIYDNEENRKINEFGR